MDDFEKQLQEALRREEPPAGFEARVLAAARRPRMAWRAWAAVAATLILAADAGWEVRQSHRERVQGEAAKAQLELALRITASKLQKIQTTINEGL